MPTKKPRVYVTLEPEVYEVLKEYSEVIGGSMSSLIASSMERASPALKSLVDVYKASDDMKASLLSAVQDEVNSQIGELEAGLRSPLTFNKGVNSSQVLDFPLNRKKS